jgi:hypothetical protein
MATVLVMPASHKTAPEDILFDYTILRDAPRTARGIPETKIDISFRAAAFHPTRRGILGTYR